MSTTSGSDGSVQGIDVSHLQGTVDWSQVALAGKTFAFIKATEGVTYLDSELATNWAGAKAAGLLRGAYHFYQPNDDPQQQAEWFLANVTLAAGDLPPVLDVETAGDAPTIVQGIEVWLTTVQAAVGCAPILYTNPSFWNSLGTSAFGAYPLWIAEYGVSAPKPTNGWTSWTFWQHSETGSVAGISSTVDLDVFQGALGDLERLARREC